jgi:hypothetical protein
LVDPDTKAGCNGIDLSGTVDRQQDPSVGVIVQNLPNALSIGIESMPDDPLRVV